MSRAARILAMLEDARYVPVDELAEALGVSRRTVAAEVNALQDLVGASASIGLDDLVGQAEIRMSWMSPDQTERV